MSAENFTQVAKCSKTDILIQKKKPYSAKWQKKTKLFFLDAFDP